MCIYINLHNKKKYSHIKLMCVENIGMLGSIQSYIQVYASYPSSMYQLSHFFYISCIKLTLIY